MPTITPLLGDRSAFDVTNHPSKHSSDLAASTPKYHVPLPTVSGNILVADGTKWVSQVPIPIMTLGTVEGDIAVAASPFRIYNLFPTNRSISKVFLSVSAAPTGADLVVDVKVDGVSIFTGGNKPKIVDGTVTGFSVTIAAPTWAINSYLTWEVTQIGSSIAGENLVVHIIHGGS